MNSPPQSTQWAQSLARTHQKLLTFVFAGTPHSGMRSRVLSEARCGAGRTGLDGKSPKTSAKMISYLFQAM